MRYLALIGFLMFAGASAQAEVAGVYQSTWSATSNHKRTLCDQGDRAYLHRVCVVDGVAASTAAVFNSTYTISGTQNLTGVIDGSVQGCFDLGIKAPNGLYVDQFGTAGLTLLFDCYR